jgi:hypothetical protein
MLEVIRMHRDSVRGIKPEHVQTELFLASRNAKVLSRATKLRRRRLQLHLLPAGRVAGLVTLLAYCGRGPSFRFAEVSIGIAVTVVLTLVWPEREVALPNKT